MNRTPQVVVVGAGIVGCAVAYELARRGARVQVIDRRDVGQGATQASAGVLAPYIEAYSHTALLDLGERSLALYDQFIESVVEDSGSTVQYVRTGTLEVATDELTVSRLEAIGEICAARGVVAELLDARGARDVEPQLTTRVQGGLLVESHGFVGVSDLTAALQRAAVAHGVSFVTSTSVARIVAEGHGIRIETESDGFTCEQVVLAAGSWSGRVDVNGAASVPVRPVRGQLLYLRWPAPLLKRVVWAPGCYLVPWDDGSVLVGATVEDVGFDERATVVGVRHLLEVTCEIVPQAQHASFQEVRVGLRPGTPDELPVIGPSTRVPGLVYASGHYRNGILLAPLTATIVGDLILDCKQDSALQTTSPLRFGDC